MAENALHGVNLTGWLTLESWVTPELFSGLGCS
jgi:glucan 1,3-beta-glucosidase